MVKKSKIAEAVDGIIDSKMLVLETLKLRNFLSYGNAETVIHLNNPGTTLIVGEDLDSGTGSSNGAGKTTILNGIVYGLFDKPLSKDIKLDELINNVNKKNMMVSITFTKNGDRWEIIRTRKGKDGNTVKLLKNGELKTLDSVDNTNKFIEEKILGYSYDLFVRIVIFSANHEPFFSLPTSGAKKPTQQDIIEELFSLTTLAEKATQAKAEIKENEQKIQLLKVTIEQIEREKARHDQQIATTEQRVKDWDSNKASKLARLKAELAEISDIDFDAEQESLKKLDEFTVKWKDVRKSSQRLDEWEVSQKAKIKKITNELGKIEGIDIEKEQALHHKLAEVRTEVVRLRNAANGASRSRVTVAKEQADLKKEANHLFDAKCPYCLQHFEGAADKMESIRGILLDSTEKLDLIDKDIAELKQSIEDKEAEIVSIEAQITVTDIESLLQIKAESSVMQERLVELKAETNPSIPEVQTILGTEEASADVLSKMCADSLKDIEATAKKIKEGLVVDSLDKLLRLRNSVSSNQAAIDNLEEETNPHSETLADLKAVELDEADYDAINRLQHVVDHQKFLVKLLTKSDSFVRKNLIDKNIPFLNKQLKENLKELGLPHKVEFTNTMTASISQLGRPLSYHNLSTGQKARVNLALAWAFRDVLQKMHSPVNFCLLDEVLDVGLCDVGISAAAKMLKSKARKEKLTMFIISHRNELDSTFERTMKVQLQKGFSKIVQ